MTVERSLHGETPRKHKASLALLIVVGTLLLMCVLVGLGYPWLVRSGFVR